MRAKIYLAALLLRISLTASGGSAAHFIHLVLRFPSSWSVICSLFSNMLAITHPWLMVKSIYLRVTLNNVTLAFFLFSFFHCFTQGILQSFLFVADDTWGSVTTEILAHANINSTIFPQYTGRHGSYSLELCNKVPAIGGDPHPCVPFFTAGQLDPITIPQRFLPPNSQVSEPGASLSPSPSGQSNVTSALWLLDNSLGIHIDSQPRPDGFSDVIITSDDGNLSITLDPICTFSLLYPEAKLSQARREELSLIGTQFWFFGLAVFALVFESIPHILALLIARLIATGWSTYALWRTSNINGRLQHIIEAPNSPCHLELYGPYFSRRTSLQIADLALHWDALFISALLSWRLYKVYRTQTFRRVGPPKDVLRMYAYFLAVLVSIQLSVFILVNAMALWVDQLLHGAIKKLSSHTVVYDGTFITTAVLLIPWLMLGWFSVRRESRKLTSAFLAIAFFFLFAWSMMFYSRVYRFTFVDWPFFGCMTVTSFVTLISSTGFAFVCLRNYDKGLAQWIYLEQSFERDDFDPDLFPTEVTEKEWKPNADRASIVKVALPELLRDDGQLGIMA
ncbi:hypothetical protein DFH94DRAFT_702089 [Russula ochroleuca]|uniref:Uncharacterized protein n=1 Tax=Russula ochroleuca TaxID=152965 RepID=A0A9P5TE67_9AGAM|nr:hypothetical protein DFH94DRAFT_702089 [Russula ochroleuca]